MSVVQSMRLGIDLGGTKIEAVVLRDDEVVARQRVATPVGDYSAILNSIKGLVQGLEASLQVQNLPVGIGHPGSLSPRTGLLRNANSTCLNGKAFKHDVENALERRVAMANDANCLALSEHYDGAARDVDSAFCVILGTGVGGAILQNGRVQLGANALAGEWGHTPLPWIQADEYPGSLCWCGQRACLETWLSGPAFERCHADAGGGIRTTSDIVAQASQGDEVAQRSLRQYTNRLARALAGIINVLDPQVIVLAGGLSKIELLYDEVPRIWGQWVFADDFSTRLVAAQHGDASGVLGAARLEQ